MAELATEVAKDNGLSIEVMDEHAMEQAGLGGMLGVTRGSDEPPRLIKLTYTPRNPTGSVALVGKGIMFDSGGLSLKSGEGMMAMKIDMSGAAAVLATMTALKATKPRVKVIGFLCCTDNMPSGTALKPGDVITIRNGKTVEVLNTDAEGRLVLADGLSLAVEEEVDAIVDLATLTGAVVGALGNRIAGVMGNDDSLMDQVRDAASRADELVWQLPLPSEYRKFLDSPVADMKNIGGTSVLGSGGGGGGALTAGLFLKEFVSDVPWVHIDLAGPAMADADDTYVTPRWYRLRRAHARRAARPLHPVGRRCWGWRAPPPGCPPTSAVRQRRGAVDRRTRSGLKHRHAASGPEAALAATAARSGQPRARRHGTRRGRSATGPAAPALRRWTLRARSG